MSSWLPQEISVARFSQDAAVLARLGVVYIDPAGKQSFKTFGDYLAAFSVIAIDLAGAGIPDGSQVCFFCEHYFAL
jgi:hypothetical protein